MKDWVELFRGAGVALAEQDLDLRFTSVFDEGRVLGGASLIGRTDDDWLPAVEATRVRAAKQLVIETRHTRTCHAVRTAGDVTRALAITITPRHDASGAVNGVLSLVADAGPVPTGPGLDGLARLASGVAHEFNNQLTVIVGYTELLREQDRISTEVEAIASAARRASQVTRQLLAFGQRQALLPERVVLDSLLRGHVRTLRRVVGTAVDVDVQVGDEPLWVEVDAGQMERVVMNLALHLRSNHASREISISVHPASHVYPSAGDRAVPSAEIRIGGSGAPTQVTSPEHALEPFFAGGLGLAEVHGLVMQMGGDLALALEGSRVAAVALWFPLASPVADVVSTATAPASAQATILVAEPDPSVREFASRALGRQGYAIVEADDALSLRQALEHTAVDLVLAEVALWYADDAALATEVPLRRADLPVLLMTGHAESLLRGSVAPATFLRKPFTPSELLDRIRDLLRRPSQVTDKQAD